MNNEIRYAGLTFTDDEIVGGEVYSATSLLSDSLEIGTLSVDLYVRDPAVWDKLAGFKRNDMLTYYHKGKLRGTYYVENVERTGKYTFTISANDAMALLDQSNHMGGIYTGQTVGELVADICNIPYQVQSKFARIKLYGWLPIATRRANLAQVLFAVGAHAKVDLLGTLRIEALWDGVSSSIPPSRVFMGDKVKYEAKVSEVSVLEHQYIQGTEEIKLFEGATLEGDVIQFNEPAHDLVASGFTIIEQGANYAKVSSGNGTLTGKKYTHTTKDVRKPVTALDVPNVVEVSEATLVSLVNSAAVADRLAGYYKYFETMQADVVYKEEIPGDVVAFEHPFGGESVGCIKSASIAIGGALVAEEKTVIGYKPPKFEEVEILENRVVLTGSGSWTPPDDVTSVRAVLISGGEDGAPGEDGSLGERPWGTNDSDIKNQSVTAQVTVSVSKSASARTPMPTAGTGGAGGSGGRGGKILQATLNIKPGAPISYSCGSAVPFGSESETVFGPLSSADGDYSATGYIDPVTGDTYAAPGKVGTNGGDGGTANKPGKDAGTAKGGQGAVYGSKSLTREDDDYATNPGGDPYYTDHEMTANFEWGNGAGGGGGGGDGENGSGPTLDSTPYSASLRGGSGNAVVRPIIGGNGGNGKNGTPAENYGGGGAGGGGGGGAGACSTASVNADVSAKWYYRSSGDTSISRNLSVRIRVSAAGATNAVPGTGGTGGAGKEGCIILYYGQQKKKVSGPFREKNNRGFLDKLGRRIIV